MHINWRRQIVGLLLATLFIGFTLSGVILINLTFTVAPFAIFGIPTAITINVGAILLLLALVTFVLLWRKH